MASDCAVDTARSAAICSPSSSTPRSPPTTTAVNANCGPPRPTARSPAASAPNGARTCSPPSAPSSAPHSDAEWTPIRRSKPPYTAAPRSDRDEQIHKKRRCRDETRTVEVFAAGHSLADTEWDGHIRAVIRVDRDVLTRSAATGLWRDRSETALFVSDVVLPAAQCAKAIRDHWQIENRSHSVRDGSFAEDASRIRCNPGIFARLRSFAANILRFNGIHNVSDGRHRIAFGGITAILAMRVMY